MLDDDERLETEHRLYRWLVAGGFSIVSIILAVTVPIDFISMSGFIFVGVLIFNAVSGRLHRRRLRRLQRIE